MTPREEMRRNDGGMALIIECPCNPNDGPIGFMIVSEIENGRRIDTKYNPYFYDDKYYPVGTNGILKRYPGKGQGECGTWHYGFTPKQADEIKDGSTEADRMSVRIMEYEIANHGFLSTVNSAVAVSKLKKYMGIE